MAVFEQVDLCLRKHEKGSLFECKRSSDTLNFIGLCMSEIPRGRDLQEGGFPACVCAGTAPGELGSPVLGLKGDGFRHFMYGQCSCVCEEKGFCSILYPCYLWDGIISSVFTPCLERLHKGMGQLILHRLLSSDLFRSSI